MDKNTFNKLNTLLNVMNSALQKQTYNYQDASTIINIPEKNLKMIYTLYTASNTEIKLTPKELTDFILEHANDPQIAKSIEKSTINTLAKLQKIMTGIISNTKYDSASLASVLEIDKNTLDLIYGLYSSKNNSQNQNISLYQLTEFINQDVVNNKEYASNMSEDSQTKLKTLRTIMNSVKNNTKYSKEEMFAMLSSIEKNIDKDQLELVYIYYGSTTEFNPSWTLTTEQFVNFLNDDILNDSRFTDFLDTDRTKKIKEAKEKLAAAKKLLVGANYSRVVINSKLDLEGEETYQFIRNIKNDLGKEIKDFYVIGSSPMAVEMSETFGNELDFITIITMVAIFIVVAISFKSLIIPLILVLIIQCAVYMTMGILSLSGGAVYFIALLIVQSILMGATIDYAILYTSYYMESRKSLNAQESIKNAYNKSIHTILTSSSILIIVTLIVGSFTNAIASKICKTLSQGTLCSTILILLFLPGILGALDRFIIKKNTKNQKV